MKKCHREEFMKHLNSVDKNIQFTAEEPGPEGALLFLDILIKLDQEGRQHTTVYRKPTHTDQYLTGTVYTLFHQNTVWSEPSITEPNHLLKPPAAKRRRRTPNQGSDEM